MENLNKIIGSNLIFLRKKAGLTQLEFGEKFSYSDKTVSRWEQGDVIPSVEVLKDIADFYGVSVDFILKEHKSEEDFSSIVKKTPYAANKILLIILVCTIIVSVCVTIYVASIYNLGTTNPSVNRWWSVFLWAVPVSSLIVAYMTKKIFNSSKMFVICISVFIWTILIAAFFSFLYKGIYWYVFFIGIPVQAALIMYFYMKK
ncbi:MAG: helix-turn-helix domain-containing protein [Bacilli bacterium]|nr:helix-turn-helix domain-containing protein [Bacilli bacterium]